MICYMKFKKSLQHRLVDILQKGKFYLSIRISGVHRDNWLLYADRKDSIRTLKVKRRQMFILV